AAVAPRAPARLRPRLDAVASASLARHGDLERDRHRRPARGLDEVDLDLRAQVRTALAGCAARAPGRAGDARARERREKGAEVAHVELRRREAARTKAGVAVAVVERAPLGAREHLVRLRHLAEAELRLWVVGNVGMQLAREPPERLLDRRIVRVTRDVEHVVVVAVCRYQSSAYTSSTKRESSCAAAR